MIKAPDYETYRKIHKALDFIASGKADGLEAGRHELGDGIYVNVSEMETRETGVFESHHRYIDIHYPITGGERIITADEAALSVTKEYDDDADYMLGELRGGDEFTVRAGQPFVVMPGEAHIPGLCVGKPEKIKKAVAKIPV